MENDEEERSKHVYVREDGSGRDGRLVVCIGRGREDECLGRLVHLSEGSA